MKSIKLIQDICNLLFSMISSMYWTFIIKYTFSEPIIQKFYSSTSRFTHEQKCRVERDAIGVRCVLNRISHCRKDEIPYEGQCYHLAEPESGLNHQEAFDYCTQRQSRLIDITSQAENNFISEWVLQTRPEVTSIMTSGVGLTTLNRTLWLWEDSSRAKFRYIIYLDF